MSARECGCRPTEREFCEECDPVTAAEPTGDVRDQIAETLRRRLLIPTAGPTRWGLQLADAVLALPAVRDALAAREAVKRVEALLPEIEVMDQRDSGEEIAYMIRDALEGEA